MCDYSLHAQDNRLARDGDELVLTAFPGGSLGFAEASALPKESWLAQARRYLGYLRGRGRAAEPDRCLMAVCLPPGAEVRVAGIPVRFQKALGLPETSAAVFDQVSADAYTYRDALRFGSNRPILLQRFDAGLRVTVLRAGSTPRVEFVQQEEELAPGA